MQALINSLTERELNIVASMVDLDCVDWTPTIEQLVDAIQMFGYSEQNIIDAISSTNQFVFEDAEVELWNDLFIHSVDSRVGF